MVSPSVAENIQAQALPAKHKRQQLIAAAQRLLALHGYSGSSVQQLAEVAGGSKNQLFHYFTGKEQLALAALELTAAQLRDALAGSVPTDPLAQARLAASRLVEHGPRSSSADALPTLRLVAVLAAERAALPDKLGARLDSLLESLELALREPLKAARVKGSAGPRPRERSRALLAALLGLALLPPADDAPIAALLLRLLD